MRPREPIRASNVLVLCDGESAATKAVVQTLQRRRQLSVRTAHNPEEALNLLGGAKWDVIFWSPRGQILPGRSGLAELKSRQPDAAVVAVVAPDELDSAAEALAEGATSYLVLGPHTDVVLDAVLSSALSLIALEARARRAEEKADRLETRLRAISELCQEAVLVVTPSGTIVDVNRAAEQTLGVKAVELVGRHASELLRPAGLFERLRAALEGPEHLGQLAEWGGAAVATSIGPAVIGVEGFVRQRSGAYVLRNVSAAAIREPSGEIRQIVLTLAPVPQDAWLSRELSASHRILDLLLASVSDAVALVDTSSSITKANMRFAELAGTPDLQSCVGQNVDEAVGARGRIAALVREAVAKRGSVTGQVEIADAGGVTRQVEATVAVFCHDDTPAGAIVALAPRALSQTARTRREARPSGLVAALRSLEIIRRARTREEAVRALGAIAEWAAALLEADAACVTLLHGDAYTTGAHGLSDDIAGRVARSSVAAISRAGGELSEIVVISDLQEYLPRAEDKQLVTTLLATGLRSCALVPLRISQDTLGVAFVASAAAGQFDQLPPIELREAVVHVLGLLLALANRLDATTYQARAETVAQASAEIAEAGEIPQLIAAAARSLKRLFEAEWAAVHLLDLDGEEIEESAMATESGQVATGAAMPADAYSLLWDAIRGTRLLVRGFKHGDRQMTGAAVRLRCDSDLLGGVVVAWSGDKDPSKLDKAILERMARYIAAMVKKLRLYQEQASRRSEMEVAAAEALDLEAKARSLLQAAAAAAELTELDEILAALAEAALRTVGLDEVALYLADHRARELRGAVRASVDGVAETFDEVLPLRRGESVYADAALSDAPYLVVPFQHEDTIAELALVPLRTRSALVGLLVGSKRLTGREITPQDLRLLRALGSIAAVVIDRARVDQLRETMAHSISHELRTPVASIRAYTELVLDEGAGPINDEQRTFLSRAVSVCEYLEQLIEDLLELSKLRAGEIKLHPEMVDLRELLDQIIDSLRPRIEEMDIEVSVRIPDDASQLYIDRVRLAQILTNLVDNAVKFNYQGGKVEVTAGREDGEIVISVTDTGPGIPPEELDAIFQEFYRGKSEAARSRTGAGLGLAIARRLAELLGGDITVDSQVGRGSTFSLRLPFRLPTESAPASGGRLEVTAGGPAERAKDLDNR